MAGNKALPFNPEMGAEFSSDLMAEQQKQALAQALLKQTAEYKGTPDSRRRIVAKTPMSHVMMNAATQWLAGEAANKAGGKIAQSQATAAGAGNAEVQRILSLPEEQQTAAAMGSKFPQAQALAKALQERDKEKAQNVEKRLGAIGSALGPVDAASANRILSTGKMEPGLVPPAPAAPKFGSVPGPDGKQLPTVINSGPNGKQTGSFGPGGGVTVTNQIPGDQRIGVNTLEAGLKPREEAAAAAKNIYAATTRAVDALQRGAQAGGGQNIKQNVRMVLQAFNVNAPDTAETAELGMALGNAILTEAAKIKPISNTDIQTLEKIVGSIGTDPTALSRALAFSQAVALDALGNFNRYVGEQGATMVDPTAKQRLAGSTIGFEVPKSLSGPTQHQLEVMRQMQMFGGDITKFNDPTGQPFQQNSKFDINPAGGYPVSQQQGLKVKRTGKDASGRKVEEMEDGSIRYAD